MAFLLKLKPKTKKDIKQQRDRFLAFAFASADLFLEVAPNHKIVYAIGAPKSMTGYDDSDLIDRNWLELFDVSEHGKLGSIKDKCIPGIRCGPIIVDMYGKVTKRKAVITGMKLPNRENFYVTICLNNTALMEALARTMEEEGIDPLTTGFNPPPEADTLLETGFRAEDEKDQILETGFRAEDEMNQALTTDHKAEDSKQGAITTDHEAEDLSTQTLTTDFEAEDEKDKTVTTGFVAEDEEEAVLTTGFVASDDDANNAATGFVPEDDGLGEAMFDNTEFIDESRRVFEYAKEHNLQAAVTVFDFGRTSTIPEENWAEMIGKISNMLRDKSVGGRAATEISEGKYSLIHDDTHDAQDIQEEITKISKELDPAGEGVEVSSKTIETNLDEMSAKEASRSLFYALREFEKAGTEFIVEGLKQGFRALVSNNDDKIAELKDIINRVDFKIFFQPVVNIKNLEVLHYEILCKFKKGDPQEWFMLAEDLNLSPSLDMAVIERVINHIKHKGGTSRTKFSVNLTQNSILDQEFIEELHEKLSYEPTLKDRLIFEISNAQDFEDLKEIKAFIKNLQEKGFTVGLDDFGISEQSLEHLTVLPADFVKFDEKFTRQILTSDRTAKIYEKAASHCKDMGIFVVAECVEDQAQADMLQDMGIPYGEGYYYGKPENAPMFIPPRK